MKTGLFDRIRQWLASLARGHCVYSPADAPPNNRPDLLPRRPVAKSPSPKDD